MLYVCFSILYAVGERGSLSSNGELYGVLNQFNNCDSFIHTNRGTNPSLTRLFPNPEKTKNKKITYGNKKHDHCLSENKKQHPQIHHS
jgi:hypothetical protein